MAMVVIRSTVKTNDEITGKTRNEMRQMRTPPGYPTPPPSSNLCNI
jgi:hypothetical protein